MGKMPYTQSSYCVLFFAIPSFVVYVLVAGGERQTCVTFNPFFGGIGVYGTNGGMEC